MGKCYKIKNLIDEKNGLYGLRNSYCLPVLSFLSEYFDSEIIRPLSENLAELSSQEIFEKLNLDESDLEIIYRKYIEDGIQRGVVEMDMMSISPLLSLRLFEEYNLSGKIFLRSKDIEKFSDVYEEFKKHKIRLGLAVDPYIDGDDLTNKISELSGKNKMPVVVTLYDDLEKTGMINSLFNKSPINYIEEIGLLDRECCILGGNYADKDDFAIMSNYGTEIIISPFDSMNFGRVNANVYSMINSGLNVKIASPLNNNISEEIKLASITARSMLNDCEILPLNEVIEIGIAKRERIKLVERKNNEEDYEKILEKIKEKIQNGNSRKISK